MTGLCQSTLPSMSEKSEAPERMDVRVPEELRARLEATARRENRSRNAQAMHYIEMGLNGPNIAELAKRIDSIESKLDEVLRRLDKK